MFIIISLLCDFSVQICYKRVHVSLTVVDGLSVRSAFARLSTETIKLYTKNQAKNWFNLWMFTNDSASMLCFTRSSAIADKSSFGEWLRFIGQIFLLLLSPFLFGAINEGDLRKLSGSYLVWEKLEWLRYILGVAWLLTQSFGHNTSAWQTNRQHNS